MTAPLTAARRVAYSSTTMVASSAKRFVLAVLVQAALIGHAVCLCEPLAKVEAGATETAGCPMHGAATPSDAAEPAAPHDADPSCPHCGTQAVLAAASADAIAAAPALYAGVVGPLSTSPTIASLDRGTVWRSARVAHLPVSLSPLRRNGVLQI